MTTQVVPARLAFLAIYNPSLGPTDDTFHDQVVFWYSRAAHEARATARKNARSEAAGGDAIREQENEKLRQIGLAQGMVDFARSFSDDRPVDSIETEKSRIVVHEMEKGWWILASIDLTRLPTLTQSSTSRSASEKAETKPAVEYSFREVSPPALLAQQLIQAHHVFALHHGPSLTELYVKLSREKFCSTLERYWTRFSRTWDVLLHGNPATDIFSGIKLSSGGELGMGVGEEEWGSGERDVLEDLARRTEGLVDLVISRFGDPAPTDPADSSEVGALPWIGSGSHPLASDGVIFGGVNAITRPSLRNVSLWMRQVYTYGDYAYGIRDNPHRERRKRRRRNPPTSLDNATKKAGSSSNQARPTSEDDSGTTLGIPDQYMKYLTFGLSTLAKPTSQQRPDPVTRTSTSSSKTIKAQQTTVSRLKAAEESQDTDDDQPALAQMDPTPDGQDLHDRIALQKRQEEDGIFMVGLKGDLANIPDDPDAGIEDIVDDDGDGPRNILRILQIEVLKDTSEQEEERTDLDRKLSEAGLSSAKNDPLNYKRLRVLVYVRRPFMYCFLFKSQTPALSLARFYRDLHRNLLPIHKPLLSSTSVARIAQRIEESQQQATSSSSDTASVTSGSKSQKAFEPKPIYDLIYDPALLTVHTSIPNIAEPGTPAAEGIISSRRDNRLPISPDWTRIEALNVHSQVLNTLSSTHRNRNEYERVSKTSRGWWVVWMRLPPSKTRETAVDEEAKSQQEVAKGPDQEEAAEVTQGQSGFTSSTHSAESDEPVEHTTSDKWLQSAATTRKEIPSMDRIAFLVRKATDPPPLPKSNTSSRAASSMWQTLTLRGRSTADEATGGASAGWGPAALTGGIGIDARKYVESLLQLNR
ncbi:hypothetical protein M409DRAFT_66348 [Zasmidium cellare ATCC 36951]|uniref:CCZ1/INTU/HSP4 first Longin domain-containing protein n=1 Tax=Zasmidium cellare ATCC 36951 TaxID=1080233 RepID=A0A6A6CHS9_ZASCE|nr:uncharacterized protein M409DRAFT_66348 [Zasmidium cellare ATCC 36951]KAF2166764.1 hypothetical protein M409DRAFT_66348 [Zasmidium cellare ATCC 36951]